MISKRCGAVLSAFLVCLVLMSMAPDYAVGQSIDTLWIENWEGNWVPDWHVDYGTWQVGVPTSGPNAAHDTAIGGTKCAATVLAGNYTEGQSTRLIKDTRFVVPAASENPRLRFWHWYHFNSGDRGYVQVRVAGDTVWQTLKDGIYGLNGDAGYGHYYSTSRWTRPKLDLMAYAGKTIELCFYFYSSDANVAPGWYLDEILVETGNYVYNDPEDWESGFDDWYTDFGTWEVGTPSVVGPSSAYEGTKCAATILNGNYYGVHSSRLIGPSFTVPAASENPRLRFWHWYSFNSGDQGQVQVRVTGDTLWKPLVSGTFTGNSSGGWTNPPLDLMAYAGKTIELCFYFYSSDANVAPGWYLDSIVIEPPPTPCPAIACPSNPTNKSICALGDEINIPIPISYYKAVTVTPSTTTWQNDTLFFIADQIGVYDFTIIATNDSCADTCHFTVNVSLNVPMQLDINKLSFSTTDTATIPPAAKKIHINSSCSDGSLNWHLGKIIGGDWLQMSKTSGSNPDSVSISVNPHGYTPGIYKGKLEFTADNSANSPIRVPVTMFLESGTDVGEDVVKPGEVAQIPITINATKPLKGFTIPLRYHTDQLQYITLDSISFDTSLIDNIIYPNDSDIIFERVVQEPPLPDSTYEIATAYFRVASGATAEYVPIDTVTISAGGLDYSYEFTFANDSVGVPLYNPGAIIITQCDDLPVIAVSEHMDTVTANASGLACHPLSITNANTVAVSGATSANWSNGQLCFQVDSSGINRLELLAGNDCGFIQKAVSLFVNYIQDSLVLKIADVEIDYGRCDTVPITVSKAISNLAGFEFHITYDPSIVRACDDIVLTDLSVTKNDTGNTVHVAWTNLSSPLNLNAGDTILSLLFEAVGTPDEVSPLTWLSNSQIIDEESTLIPGCRYHNGSVEVSIPADNICGEIVYYKDLETAVAEVNVTLDGSVSRKDTTDDGGLFCFDEVANGSYEVTPQSNRDDLGVSISDALLIQRYVVRLDEFTPYQMIAGDVNQDCRVSITDVVAILNKITLIASLPSGNWTFIDRAYNINTTNWGEAPDGVDLVVNGSTILNNNFVGVRNGDVNGDWSPSQAGLAARTLFAGNSNAILEIESAETENNGIIAIPVSVANAEQVAGYELHLSFDIEKLHYSGYATELDGKVIVNVVDDKIHIAWIDVEKPLYASSNTDLISLEFEAADLADSARFTLDQVVIADSKGQPYMIETNDGYVNLKPTILPDGYALRQNYPNPFNPTTTIQLAMPISGQYEIGIYNIVGQKIKTFTGYGEAGIVRVEWNGCNDMGVAVASGIYLYKVTVGDFRDSRKMLLLK
ncbi:MAG: cohesin domain-containing protein [candidate division Zixibacteria bacterium]|nr:cohesin domain-containing protein [candidate division Zixibacteria bacterium]